MKPGAFERVDRRWGAGAFYGSMRAYRVAHLPSAVESIMTRAGTADELDAIYRARDAGVLTIDDIYPVAASLLTQSGLAGGFAWPSESLVQQMIRTMGRATTDEPNVYPMFDASALGLASQVLPGTELITAATEPHLAVAFIGRLQTFPDARMDEILDVRKALADPLVRFRSAVSEMARNMEETPIDDGFGRAADALYRETVAPALLELRELEEERHYLHQLARQASIGEAAPNLATAMGLAAAAYVALPNLAAAAAGLAGGLLSSVHGLATAVARERDRLAGTRRANKFLFLAQADERLGRD